MGCELKNMTRLQFPPLRAAATASKALAKPSRQSSPWAVNINKLFLKWLRATLYNKDDKYP